VSYDLYLVRVPPGAEPFPYAEQAMTRELGEDEFHTGEPVPENEARKQAIARALIAADPELTVFPFDYAEIARFSRISESEARLRYRRLELNGPEHGPGIQITLHDDTASVTLPYWHEAVTARQVWLRAWSYLQVLEREGGFRTYDPQLEVVLDLTSSIETLLDQYGYGVRHTQEIAESYASGGASQAAADSQEKPWWKFWES
jgi:hypothetical protein